MRHTKTISLYDNRAVMVKELRVKDVRQLLAGFNTLENIDIKALLGPRFTEISELVAPFINFPKGETLDDLTGSELQLVLDGFMEVNANFLTLAGMAPAAIAPAQSSTEPAVS